MRKLYTLPIGCSRGHTMLRALSLVVLLTTMVPTLTAQGADNNPGHWEGTLFNVGLEKITQNAPEVFLLTARSEVTYDSNVLSSQYAQLSSAYTLLEGEAQYSVEGPTGSILLTYLGGGRFYPQYSNLNTSLQDGRAQWQRSFTKRSRFAISGRWADLPEGATLAGSGAQSFLLSNQMSALFLQQRAEIVEGRSSFEYDLNARTTVSVGGSYDSTKNYGLDLINTRGTYAYAELSYRPALHQNIGIMYAHQWLYFSMGFASSHVDNLLLTYSNKLTRNFSFSAFGGPARTSLTPGSTSASEITPAQHGIVGGAELEAGFGHNKYRVGYTRVVTGGSGFLATVLRQTVDVRFSRSMGKRFEASFVGAYDKNLQIGTSSSNFRTFYVEPSIHYDITRHLRWSVRDSIGQLSGLQQFGSVTRNQVTTQLECRFNEFTLGR